MPEGETGEIAAGVGVAPGTGDDGEVFVGMVVAGGGMVDDGCCFASEEDEKMAAVTAEPANAEAAAIRAKVVLDIVGRVTG